MKILEQSARVGGRVLMKYYKKLDDFAYKTGFSDIVTLADTEAQKSIVLYLREKFQSEYPKQKIGFLAEEGLIEKSVDITFVIDPLDGTSNFESGFPIFTVCIGLMNKDESINAGVVYDPIRDIMYRAERGRGAYKNDKKMYIQGKKALADSLILTYRHASYFLAEYSPFFARDTRSTGSLAFDVCTIAAGEADVSFAGGGKIWDYAAASIILEEAGGTLRSWSGKPVKFTTADPHKSYPIVAGSERILKLFVPYVAKFDPKKISTPKVGKRGEGKSIESKVHKRE